MVSWYFWSGGALWSLALRLVLLTSFSVWVCSCSGAMWLVSCVTRSFKGLGLLAHFLQTVLPLLLYLPLALKLVLPMCLQALQARGKSASTAERLSRSSADLLAVAAAVGPQWGSCLPAACGLFSQPAYRLSAGEYKHTNRLLWRLHKGPADCPACQGVSCDDC